MKTFRYERNDPANVIKEWLSEKGSEELRILRNRTDASIDCFIQFLNTKEAPHFVVQRFRRVLDFHDTMRKIVDMEPGCLAEQIELYPDMIGGILSALGIQRMNLLLGEDRYNIMGVVQLIELEDSGSIDFENAIGVDEESRPLRERRWEEMMSSGRLEELTQALLMIPGIDRADIPRLIAKAVIDASQQPKVRWAEISTDKKTGEPVFGSILIDKDAYKDGVPLILTVICQWFNVVSRLGRFQGEGGKEFLEDFDMMESIINLVLDKLYFPFQTELADFDTWENGLRNNFDRLRNCKFLKEIYPAIDADAFSAIQGEFSRLLDIIDQEGVETCKIYWPLHRAANFVDRREKEWEQLRQRLANCQP